MAACACARDRRAGILLLVKREQAHHEAWCAEAALRAVAFDHCLLRGVQRAIFGGNVLGRPERHAADRMRQADAAVDGTVFEPPVHRFGHGHRTSAAIAAGAALLHRRAVHILPQQFQKCSVGWYIAQLNKGVAVNEAKGSWLMNASMVRKQRGSQPGRKALCMPAVPFGVPCKLPRSLRFPCR